MNPRRVCLVLSFFLLVPIATIISGCELALEFDRSLINPEPEGGPPKLQSDGAPDGAKG